MNSVDYQPIEPSTQRPAPRPPTISVVISSPVIQIINVGETVRLPCSGYNKAKRVSVEREVFFGGKLMNSANSLLVADEQMQFGPI